MLSEPALRRAAGDQLDVATMYGLLWLRRPAVAADAGPLPVPAAGPARTAITAGPRPDRIPLSFAQDAARDNPGFPQGNAGISPPGVVE